MAKSSEAVRVIVKKKKASHAAHHGGAWKVAYADFVTAMMALFMVLWLLTQADVKLRSQIAQYFRDPGILPGGSVVSQDENPAHLREPNVVERDIVLMHGPELKKRQERQERDEKAAKDEEQRLETQARAIEQAIQKLAVSDDAVKALRDQVIVEVRDSGLSIQVMDKAGDRQLLFDVSSAELKPPLVHLLQKIAAVLGELPNPVQVGGHTDSRPYAAGSNKSNWELSFERADNARRVLESSGLRARQVTQVIAFADSEPLVPDDPLADQNRRLSILAQRTVAPPGGVSRGEGPVVLPPDKVPGRATAPADQVPDRTAALDTGHSKEVW